MAGNTTINKIVSTNQQAATTTAAIFDKVRPNNEPWVM